MGNYISWIESGSDIFYLTEEQLNSPRGRKLFGSKKRKSLDEEAIIDYFDLKHTAKAWVAAYETFLWSKDLPPEIKDSWNSGKLDFLFKDLPSVDEYGSYYNRIRNSDSLEVTLRNAPTEFYLWALKNRFTDKKGNFSFAEMAKCEDESLRVAAKLASEDFSGLQKEGNSDFREIGYVLGNDLDKMKKDEHYSTRQIGYYLTKDFTGMEQDSHTLLREIGHLANKNFAGLVESDKILFRMAGYSKGNLDFKAMNAREREWETRVLSCVGTDNFEEMKRNAYDWGVWDLDTIACLKTNDFELLKKNSSWDEKALGYILSNDWIGLTQDTNSHHWRLLGSYHTGNFNWAKRDYQDNTKKIGIILSNNIPLIQRPVLV
ncbi:MAG TPA: hypothetical protein PLK34_02000 [Candidatus Pacearchaeota archaeon]|nr:hypothetical protein [Candidatus Pacearchaeota archaeon]